MSSPILAKMVFTALKVSPKHHPLRSKWWVSWQLLFHILVTLEATRDKSPAPFINVWGTMNKQSVHIKYFYFHLHTLKNFLFMVKWIQNEVSNIMTSFSAFMNHTCNVSYIRDHFVYAPSQWGSMLQCTVISHWLGAFTKRSKTKSFLNASHVIT